MRLATLAAVGLVVGATAQAKDPYAKFASLTVDQFAGKITKRDDDLTTNVVYSTREGYRKRQSSGGWLLGIDSDAWLTAAVDKRTHLVTYVLIADPSWIGSYTVWQRAVFTTDDGPRDALVLDGSSARMGTCVSAGCSYDATIGIPLDEATMRQAADNGKPWRFRIVSLRGTEFEVAVPSVEVKALLNAVR